MNTDKIYAETLASEYAPKDTTSVIALKKLDRKAKMPSVIFAYSFGIITSLIAGVGMCLAMGVIGTSLSIAKALGIVIGIIGFVGMGVNYSIYKKIRENGKKKYAFEITELAKEIVETEN